VVPDLIHPFFGEIAKGLSSMLREKVVTSSFPLPRAIRNWSRTKWSTCSRTTWTCFVVASCRKDTDSLRRISEAGVPLVLVDRSFPGFRANFVGVDDVKVASGYRTPHCGRLQAHCAHPRAGNQHWRVLGVEGYRNALARHGMRVASNYVVAMRRSNPIPMARRAAAARWKRYWR